MSLLINALKEDIQANFNDKSIDDFLRSRATVSDLIIRYFSENKNVYTNIDLANVSKIDLWSLCCVVEEKILHYAKIKSDVVEIMISLTKEKPFNFSSLDELKQHYQ